MAPPLPARHTPRSKAMLGGAAVLAILALAIAWSGFRAYRRAATVADALVDFHRSTAGGEAALRAATSGVDAFPEEPALLLLRASALAARARAGDPRAAHGGDPRLVDLDHAAEAFRALAEVPGGDDDDRLKGYRALGRLGAGAMALERARRASEPAGRERSLADAEKELDRAASLAARRPEPRAFRAVLALERGDAEKATGLFADAERGPERPSAGGLLTLYAGEAEALARRRDWKGAAVLLEKAILVAPSADPPALPELTERLARAVARNTAGEGPMAAVAGPLPEASREAIAIATRLLLNVEKKDAYRAVPLFGIEPRHASEIRRAIGAAEARGGDLAGARRTFEQALRDFPSDPAGAPPVRPAISRDLGAVLVLLFQREAREGPRRELAQAGGEALVASVEELDRAAFEALLDAGVLLARAGSLDASLQALRRAEKIDAAGARLYRAFGVTYDLYGKKSDAVDAYKKAIDRAPNDPATAAIEERLKRLVP